MSHPADEHLELEKIFWKACFERDPNEFVELSIRLGALMRERCQREAVYEQAPPAGPGDIANEETTLH